MLSRRYVALCTLVLLVGMVLVGPAAAANYSITITPFRDGQLLNNTQSTYTDKVLSPRGTAAQSTDDTLAVQLQNGTAADTYLILQRGIILFNTSGLSANGTTDILGATVKLWGYSKANGLGSPSYAIVGVTPLSLLSSPGVSDYGNYSDTLYSDALSYASLTTTGDNTFTFNATGIAAINKTGMFAIGIKDSWDYTKTAPTYAAGTTSFYVRSTEYTNAARWPRLTITYDQFPEAAFSGTPLSGDAPLSVTFTDASVNTSQATYQWQYSADDGITWVEFSTDQNPVYSFPTGIYDIREIVTNPSGSDVETKDNYVESNPVGSYRVKIIGSTVTGEYPNGTVIASGTAGTDDSDVITGVTANASAESTIAFSGAFVPTGQINITKNLKFTEYGNASFLWNIGSGSSGDALFYATGSFVGSGNLTADANPSDTVLHVSTTALLANGDLLLVSDNTQFNPNDHPGWSTREMQKVVSFTSDTITIADPIIQGFNVSADIGRYSIYRPVTVSFDGITIYSTDTTTNTHMGIYARYVKDSSFTNLRIDRMGHVGVGAYLAYNTTATDNTISDSERSGYGYGITIADASSFANISSNIITSCRHAIALDETNNLGYPKNVTISYNNLTGYDNADDHVLDAHPSVLSADIHHNNIYDGGYISPGTAGYTRQRLSALAIKDLHYWNNTHFVNGTAENPGTSLAIRPKMLNATWIVENNVFSGSGMGMYIANDSSYYIGLVGDTSYDYLYFHGNTNSSGIVLIRFEQPSSGQTTYPYLINYFDTDAFPPMPIFSAVQSIPSVGKKQVAFTDNTTAYSALNVAGVPASWVWDATDVTGNGTIVNVSTSQNPTLIFPAGNYSITLTASNAAGSNTTTTAYWVNVSGSDSSSVPIVDFSANSTAICYGAAVAFTDASTNVSSWSWTFGDGGTSTEQSPTHVYNISSGYFTVALTGTNGLGSDTETKTNYIEVQGSCSGGGTTPTAHPFSSATGQTTILAALSIIGVGLIVFGAVFVYAAFKNQSTAGLTLGIFVITLGAIILIMSYAVISPIMNLV